MSHKTIAQVWLGVALAGALVGCPSGGTNPPAPPPPPTGSGIVTGFVTDINNGGGISGAKVRALNGSAQTTTDARGAFTLTGLATGSVKLEFTKTGFAPSYDAQTIGTGEASSLVTLKKEGAEQAYNAATTQTLVERTEAGPYAVILSPNSLDTTETNLKVSITPVDPTKEADVLPGDLATSSTFLVPVTFAEFSILDSSGKRLNLKPGSSAIVEMPIPALMRGQYKIGDKIHCYAYNPVTGKWEDFVEGTVVASSVDGSTPVLRASIRHFSWYGGAPEPEDQECWLVEAGFDRVPGQSGTFEKVPGAVIEAFPGGKAITDANGRAYISAKKVGPRESVKFTATRTYTNSAGTVPELPRTAKIIDIGRYSILDPNDPDSELFPLLPPRIPGPCPAGGSSAPRPRPQAQPEALRLKMATVGSAVYDANAFLASGSIFVSLEQGAPAEGGGLESPSPVSGARVTLVKPDGSILVLAEVTPDSGLYAPGAGSSLTLEAGQLYTLRIDANNDGAPDGSGTVFAVGDTAFTAPAAGSSVPSSGLKVKWTDSATGVNPAYAPTYQVFVYNNAQDPNDLVFDLFAGSGLEFTPVKRSFLDPTAPPTNLPAGQYTASLTATSGPFAASGGGAFGGGITISDNITGVGLSGRFYSFGTSDTLNFTVQ